MPEIQHGFLGTDFKGPAQDQPSLHLAPAPEAWQQAAQRLGVDLVAFADWLPGGVSGLPVLHDGQRLVLIAVGLSQREAIITLAHEARHWQKLEAIVVDRSAGKLRRADFTRGVLDEGETERWARRTVADAEYRLQLAGHVADDSPTFFLRVLGELGSC